MGKDDGGCFPGSTGVLAATAEGTEVVAMKELHAGHRVRAVDVVGAALVAQPEDADFLGWAKRDASALVEFLELECGGDPGGAPARRVRVTRDHFVVARRDASGAQEVVKATQLEVGYLLPVWHEGAQSLTWEPLTASRNVTDVGLYLPLVTKSDVVVTEDGIVVPLIAQGHDARTREETTNVTPQEAHDIYRAWIRDYAVLTSQYPCLLAFDEEYDQTVVTELMKQYFDRHPHDVEHAVDPFAFLAWLRREPEDVVGEAFALHLRAECPDLLSP